MTLRPPTSTRTDTLFPSTTRFRSHGRGRAPGPTMGPRVKPEGDGVDGPLTASKCQSWNIETPTYGGHPWRTLARWDWTLERRSFRSEEHTSELQSLMRISYAVFCLKKKNRSEHRTHIKQLTN